MNIADVKEVRDVVVLWSDGEIARWEACSLVADCIVRNANATLDGFDEGLRLDIIEWLKGLARVESAADVVTWNGRPEVEEAVRAAFYPRQRDAIRAWLKRQGLDW